MWNEPCWDPVEVKPTRCRSGPDTEKSCILRLHLKNYISWLRTHFLDLGLGWGLYIHYQDTARALRSFLVVISASRALWRGVYALESICDMCSREILTLISSRFWFFRSQFDTVSTWLIEPIPRDANRAAKRRNRSTNGFCGPKVDHDDFSDISRQQLYFFITDTWL